MALSPRRMIRSPVVNTGVARQASASIQIRSWPVASFTGRMAVAPVPVQVVASHPQDGAEQEQAEGDPEERAPTGAARTGAAARSVRAGPWRR